LDDPFLRTTETRQTFTNLQLEGALTYRQREEASCIQKFTPQCNFVDTSNCPALTSHRNLTVDYIVNPNSLALMVIGVELAV
jgi:hypothetical protein